VLEKLIEGLFAGGPILIGIIFMFLVWMRDNKKPGNKLSIDERLDSIDELCQIIWDAHNHKDEDGVYVWHLRQSWIRQQEEIKGVLQDLKEVIKDVHNGQKRQTDVLSALVEKINK